MIALYLISGFIVGWLFCGFVEKLPPPCDMDFRFKVYRVFECSYAKWMYYIANGVNNVSDKNTGYLLQDLGIVTKLLAELIGEKDATLDHYVGDAYLEMQRRNDDEH